jgi:hypothetical protein
LLALKREFVVPPPQNFLLREGQTFAAVRLVCLAGDVALLAPVEIAVG